ncbi:MAG: ribose ABC transporter permease [Firmicutes bacterium]|nr:ribose ABC transporter permease [Bacillota bacterium]
MEKRPLGWLVSRFPRRLGPLAGLLALAVALSLLSDRFLTLTNLLNVTRQVSINAIIAAGMTLVILTGGIDLSVGSILALAGAVTARAVATGQPVLVAVASGLGVGLAAGLVNGLLVTRGRVPAFIATLGTMTALRGLTLTYTGGRPITGLTDSFRALGGGYLLGLPVPVVIMALVFAAAWVFLTYTRPGRYVYALGSNREAVRTAGVPTVPYETLVYVLSGLTAALAGVILTARLNSAQPTAGMGFELDAIAAVVLGGTSLAGGSGGVGGTLVGAMIIGVLDNGLNLLNVSSFYQQVVKGLVILLAVLLDRARK